MRDESSFVTPRVILIMLFAAACRSDGIEEHVPRDKVKQPRVVLRSPQANATFPWDAEIRIAADIHDIAGAVEFGAADAVIARDMIAPYETIYRARRRGPVVITAQVRDGRGSVVAGDAVTVIVLQPGSSSAIQELSGRDIAMAMGGPEPLVILKAPRDGEVLRAVSEVYLLAEAAGLKAPLTRIEFLVDGRVVKQESVTGDKVTGDVFTKPYEYHWRDLSAGTHVITVRAIDGEGRVGTSGPATVVIESARFEK